MPVLAATPRADGMLPAGRGAPGTGGRHTVWGRTVALAEGRRQVELPARHDELFAIGAKGTPRRGRGDHLSQSTAKRGGVLAGQRSPPDRLEAFFGRERDRALKALSMLAAAALPGDVGQAGKGAAEGGRLLEGRAVLAGVEVDLDGVVAA